MSSVESKPSIQAMSNTQSIAQKLAYRMVQVDANIEKIESLFALFAVFQVDGHVMDREHFFKNLKTNELDNISAIGEWTDSFSATSKTHSNEIIWTSIGFQFCQGKGLDEKGPGWYECKQGVKLAFVEEEGKTKISSFVSVRFAKKFISSDFETLLPLPRTQKLIHKLAYRSFQIPQVSEKLCSLYDDSVIIFLRPDENVTLEEFREAMKKSNTENVDHLGPWENRYLPDNCCSKSLQWHASGYQDRRGLGYQESGAGWYKIRQVARFHFTEDETKISLHDNLSYSKTGPDKR